MGTERIELPDAVAFILGMLHQNNYEAYVVGGCVRDSILGRKPKDWDITTNAKPEEIKALFHKTIDTGIKHGTVTVVIDGEGYEVTTYRVDGNYSDGRHPDSVEFTSNLCDDLERRDFTMNAIAYNEEQGFIDPYNGLDDIYKHVIKCVESPRKRFQEDGLRILRAIRFSAQLGFTIDDDTDFYILTMYNKCLENISKERIQAEFCKIIMSSCCNGVLKLYREVFAYIIPEIEPMFNFEQNNPNHQFDVWEHTLYALTGCYNAEIAYEKDIDLITRLAVFFHDIGKPHCYTEDLEGVGHFYSHPKKSEEITRKVLIDLRFSNEIIDNVCELVLFHDGLCDVKNKRQIRKCLNKISSVEQFERLLIVRLSDIIGQETKLFFRKFIDLKNIEAMFKEVLEEDSCFKLKDLAINGKDLIKIGIPEGKEIGRILNELLEKVINEELENNKNIMIKYVKENM